MDYLKILRENPDLAEEFDSLFDFFLLDELSPRDEADGRATFTLPDMAFARDGSGGEYHLCYGAELCPLPITKRRRKTTWTRTNICSGSCKMRRV